MWESLQAKLVRGENIAQAYQFFYSGNVSMAYVAKSQVQKRSLPESVCVAVVSAEQHQPIVQKAVVLKRADGKVAMDEFLHFFETKVVRSILERYGYLAGSS
ncbi:molybdenum ABC transporter Molybdate-binding protein [gamma proteobacterium HTCC5015]|nr:molybdenum ABC transporter Molybdate-binding protein [gamma proteobacterium HTCC5015]